MEDISKTYEPKEAEDKIYSRWEASGFFNPDNLPGKRKESFTVVLPPPNVTGTLHIGHAMMLAIEDIMIRFARMSGKKTLWVPGTDHAAIATQAVVEKKLIKEGIKDPRHTLEREKFLAEVEKFAQASHDRIITQVKKMGASCDFSREAYTLDEKRSLAVRAIFKMMYDDGLIYRGNRIVNWCPHCQSTLADDEVQYREEPTRFYYFKYGPVVIGTARPETKFLDKTIVVHPDDARYKDLVGKEFEVEWIEGKVKANVIADPVIDKEFGTGAMTITPAHSFEDFDLAQKNNLPVVQIIDEDGDFTIAAGSFAEKNARQSREAIVEILKKKGLVDHVDENYIHNLSVCYRCGTPVEPLPKLQWFVDVKKKVRGKSLKDRMREVVPSEIKIIPERFLKTYFHWIDNLRDWCISRQIWFGHRVPVWYKGDEIFVGIDAPAGEGWKQDEDTLDTWFSSGTWTFSTLGWPSKTKDLKTYHPTSVLETGYDILFFWVARMIMMSVYALGEIPFKTVYLHGLVRDEEGRKMSKSLGNVIDPLDMIEKYGADATRLSLVLGTSPGNDIKLSEAKIAGFRNFTNKLWNISRFVLMTVGDAKSRTKAKTLADKWILGSLAEVTFEVTKNLEQYNFSAAGEILRDFSWGDFADWYLEVAKHQMLDEKYKKSTQGILRYCLEEILKLWHPFTPFVTENLWEQLGCKRLLIVEPWPKSKAAKDSDADVRFQTLRDIVGAIRNIRSTYHIEPKKSLDVIISAGKNESWLKDESKLVRYLAKINDLKIVKSAERPEDAVSYVFGGIEVFVLLFGVVDLKKEAERINSELEETRTYVKSLEVKLRNNDFTSRAPAPVVETMRTKLAEANEKIKKLEEQLKMK